MPILLLLANPAASGFTGGLYREVLATLKTAFDVEVGWPGSPDEARAMATEASSVGADVVVAVGGDGVVHHVANGLSPHTALGIIPAGTTNVLARILDIPERPKKAAQYIAETADRRPSPVLDTTLVTADGAVSARRATFSLGTGFDAEVVELAEQEPFRKYRFGSLHYVRSATSVLWSQFRDRAATIRVTAGERSADAVAVMVQLHDEYTYFGRVPLRIGAAGRGRLSALIVEELTASRVPSLLARATAGRSLDPVSGYSVWNDIETLEIEADPASTVQADGELLGSVRRLEVNRMDDALTVIAPTPTPRRRRLNLLRR